MPSPPIHCPFCGHTWTAPSAAHCGTCHEHFGSPTAFDRHRASSGTEHGVCLDPATVGLVRRDGAWRGEPMAVEVVALRATA